jgi:long-chain fatty acid transport protein
MITNVEKAVIIQMCFRNLFFILSRNIKVITIKSHRWSFFPIGPRPYGATESIPAFAANPRGKSQAAPSVDASACRFRRQPPSGSTTFVLVALSALLLVASASRSWSGGFGVREQSTTGLAVGYAGVASGSAGLSSIFWNPATITLVPGLRSEIHGTLLLPRTYIRTEPGTSPFLGTASSGDIAQDALIPATYHSAQINSRLWVGLSATAPFGLSTKPNADFAGQFYARSSRASGIAVTPIVGFKVNDWLSIGLGGIAQTFKITLKSAAAPGPGAPSAILDGSSTGFGVSAGFNVRLAAATYFGLGYRSPISQSLRGSFNLPGVELPAESKLTLPETVTAGLSHAVSDQLALHLGFEWTHWSRLRESAVNGPFGPIDAARIRLNYNNGWVLAFGATYQVSPIWTLKAGIGYEKSPINTANRTTSLPDATHRVWLTSGVSYRFNSKLDLDLTYSHVFFSKAAVSIVPGNPAYNPLAPLPFFGTAKSSLDVVSVALRYRWDTP